MNGPATRVCAALAGLVLLLAGCSSVTGILYHGDELTFAQYESIRPGMTAAEIRDIYGEPNEVRLEDGRVARQTFLCYDESGRIRTVDLEFDRQEVLVRKSLW